MGDFEYVRQGFTKGGEPFYLRPAQSADADQIIANIRAVCAEQIYLATDTFVPTPEWSRALKHSVDEEEGTLLIVAEVGGTIVGHLRLFPLWYGSKGRHVGEIGIVLISPWREQGIGKAMLSYAIDWARMANFNKLSASIFSTNLRALNLFSIYNFVQEGYRPRQFLVDEQYVDEVLMGRSV